MLKGLTEKHDEPWTVTGYRSVIKGQLIAETVAIERWGKMIDPNSIGRFSRPIHRATLIVVRVDQFARKAHVLLQSTVKMSFGPSQNSFDIVTLGAGNLSL